MTISVIIPIYNVEEYLRRCIESVIRQTFTDIEIILVNDGSTDNSGQIVEDYKTKDARIKVIHKVNGGLSDARNIGMMHAGGKYIFFLDSDDWIAEDTLQLLLNYMEKYEADIVTCGFYYAYDNDLWIDRCYLESSDEVFILNNKEGMKALLENKIVKNFAWGKLYKKEIIQDIPFEKGILFEDVYWQPQVFARSNRCIVTKEAKCYYYQRAGSIVGEFNIRKLDMLRELQKRHQFIQSYYGELIAESWYAILKVYLEYYILLFLNQSKIRNKKYIREIRCYLNTHYKILKKYSQKDKQLQISLRLFRIHPYLMLARGFLKKIIRRLGLIHEESVIIQVQDKCTPLCKDNL